MYGNVFDSSEEGRTCGSIFDMGEEDTNVMMDAMGL